MTTESRSVLAVCDRALTAKTNAKKRRKGLLYLWVTANKREYLNLDYRIGCVLSSFLSIHATPIKIEQARSEVMRRTPHISKASLKERSCYWKFLLLIRLYNRFMHRYGACANRTFSFTIRSLCSLSTYYLRMVCNGLMSPRRKRMLHRHFLYYAHDWRGLLDVRRGRDLRRYILRRS